MLILTRRVGEKIRLNSDIVVQVLEINGLVVQLGIIAPRDVTVEREEKTDKALTADKKKLSSLAPHI